MITAERDLQFLLEKIQRNRGVDFSQYRKGTLHRRILSRLRATQCSDYSDYLLYLNREPKEYDELLDAISISVTEFFRDVELFHKLQDSILPEIISRKEAKEQFR